MYKNKQQSNLVANLTVLYRITQLVKVHRRYTFLNHKYYLYSIFSVGKSLTVHTMPRLQYQQHDNLFEFGKVCKAQKCSASASHRSEYYHCFCIRIQSEWLFQCQYLFNQLLCDCLWKHYCLLHVSLHFSDCSFNAEQ